MTKLFNFWVKTTYIFAIVIGLSFFSFVSAGEITKHYDLNYSTGAAPGSNSLTSGEDGTLYGLISQGGAYDGGVIFSYDPNAESPYVDLYDFDGASGGLPSGGLVLGNDGIFYGMTTVGGTNGYGVIFSYDPNSENPYVDLYDFAGGTDGRNPYGSLSLGSNGILYGMTQGGGINSQGIIFSYEPGSENPYNKLHDFEISEGRFPYGSLVLGSDEILYGMTAFGGTYDNGVIFSYDPNVESPFHVIYNFDGNHGVNPRGSLVEGDDGIFYGLVRGNEDYLDGFIFSFDPDSESPFIVLHDFSGTDGSDPFGSLVRSSSGTFYGVTSAGGLNNMGVIFSFNPNSENSFKKLFDFDNYIGKSPFGSLIENNDQFLYGVTQSGGESDMGIIFQFDPTPQPPKALDLYITGVRSVGSILTGHYTYTDTENDPEGVSIYKWYRDGVAITGADSTTYTLTSEDIGKLIEFEVTPVSQVVPSIGETVRVATRNSIIVNSPLDDGDGTCTQEKCTLRDAIGNSSEENTIEFGEFDGPIILTQGYIQIDHDLTIEGPGSSILSIDGNSNDMIFYISNGMVSISGLTFTNGLASNYAGAIENYGDSPLFIDNCVFSNNDSNGEYGGAIYDDSFSTLTITNSTFTGNTAYDGGAIFTEGGDLIVTNSTFDNNSAENYGGVIYHYGYGDLIITNSTFVNNTDSGDGSIESYANLTKITNSTFYNDDKLKYNGLYLNGDTLITNSIFYSVNNYNCYDGSYTSGGHNIDSGSSCGFSGEGDINFISGYTDLYHFNQIDGLYPNGALIEGNDGVFYGLTSNGGAETKVGTIFTYEPNSEVPFKKLYDFDQEDGGFAPDGSLIKANNGIYYGLTSSGGLNSSGTIFSYEPGLEVPFTKLHDFANLSIPKGSLIEGENGILYGLSYGGGDYSSGYIFSYNPNSETPYTKLYDLSAVDTGSHPNGSLLFASDGIFYGMTEFGGSHDKGVIFSFNPDAEIPFVKLYDFDGTTGSYPRDSLIEGSNGLFYGMTYGGGENDSGVIFSYNPDVADSYLVIHSFDEIGGNYPYGSLIEGSDGLLYGLTSAGGGLSDCGVIFSYDRDSDVPYTDLYDFNTTSGGCPLGSLVEGNDGMLYGVTSYGGEYESGVIFSYERNASQASNFDELKNNGGPVETVAIKEGSPAIDAGDDTQAPETDARGYVRLSTSDIGAYEYGGVPPSNPEESDETCYDGIQNQDETGIDSGGICSPDPIVSRRSSGSVARQLLVALNPVDDRGCLSGYLFNVQTGKLCPIQKSSTTDEDKLSFYRVLKSGMEGDDVRKLQIYLNSHGYILSSSGAGSPGLETMKFGPLTRKAVIKFQLANGLVGDGIVGTLTQVKLK